MAYDDKKIETAVLALLHYGSFERPGSRCAWKTYDWAITERLFEQGLIDDPRGKSKSLVFTPEGEALPFNLALVRTGRQRCAVPAVSSGPPFTITLARHGTSSSYAEAPGMLKTYIGSCHCGAVRFEADLDLTASTYRCNCSICRRNRFWVAVAKPEGFRLLSGEHEMTEYLFNTRKNQHFFCRHCGVRAFGIGNETPIGKMYGINVGCLEGVSEEELSKVPITYVDGMNDRWHEAPAFFSHL